MGGRSRRPGAAGIASDAETERSDRVSEQDERKIKVTDKRMFAPDGTLREEYRFLEEETKPPTEPVAEGAQAAGTRAPERTAPASEPPKATPEPGPAEPETSPLEPGVPGGGPSFVDLVAALAEPASVYMRNAIQSPAEASQSLEVARLYIDLLDVLRHKTAGNLTVQEKDMLEDALHQLRLGYVRTKG